MFCSSDCDSVDENKDEDDEETADATEIQENMMDITTSRFAHVDIWLVLILSGIGISNEVSDPGGAQGPMPTAEGYSLFIVVTNSDFSVYKLYR